MAIEQDVEPAEPSAADQNPQTNAPAPAAAEPSPAKEAVTTTPAEKPRAAREALIAKLTHEKSTEPATPETQPSAAAEPAVEDGQEDPEAAETPAAPEVEAAQDDQPETPAKADRRKPKAEERIHELTKERDALKPVANFGGSILKTISDAGIPPADFKDWVDLGVEISTGDPAKAVDRLIATAKALGYQPPAAPAAAVILDDALDEKLDALAENGDLTPQAAREIRRMLKAKDKAANAAPIAKQPDPVQQPVQRQVAPPASRPDVSTYETRKAAAVTQMDAVSAKYQKSNPADYAKLDALVQKSLAAHKGAPPEAWPAILDAEFAKVLAQNRQATPGAFKAPLATTRGPSTAQPQFKSERARTIHNLTKG